MIARELKRGRPDEQPLVSQFHHIIRQSLAPGCPLNRTDKSQEKDARLPYPTQKPSPHPSALAESLRSVDTPLVWPAAPRMPSTLDLHNHSRVS